MTPDETAAWEEFKSAHEDDEVWARLAAEAREDDFAAWIDEQILEEAARLNPSVPRCADTLHQFHSFDVCATCGFVTERA